MGGEHEIGIHNKGHCHWLHGRETKDADGGTEVDTDEGTEVEIDEEDERVWKELKPEILKFILRIRDRDQKDMRNESRVSEKKYDKVYDRIVEIESAKDIYLFWSYRMCGGLFGDMMHDIAHLLIINFPGKICGYFERCLLSEHQWVSSEVESWYDPKPVLYSYPCYYKMKLYE